MLTMFEVTLGNWVPACRLLVEVVSEVWSPLFMIYLCVVGFSVVKVITGVFLHETFKVAGSDDELMIMQKERVTQKHRHKMQRFLMEADNTGDGRMDYQEFDKVMTDERVRTWLSAMGLEVRDVKGLFELLDDGDHTISSSELCNGVSRLKGEARSLDLII